MLTKVIMVIKKKHRNIPFGLSHLINQTINLPMRVEVKGLKSLLKTKVVQHPREHKHLQRGNAAMVQDRDHLQRPTFAMQIGNTMIKIRSALPFMSPEDQQKWWEENDSSPEVRMFKRAWIDSLIQVAEAEQQCDSA